jgi:predicted alpha/beta hydrolase
LREFGSAMIEGRHVHRAQDTVGHIGWARDLQEMFARMDGHRIISPLV